MYRNRLVRSWIMKPVRSSLSVDEYASESSLSAHTVKEPREDHAIFG